MPRISEEQRTKTTDDLADDIDRVVTALRRSVVVQGLVVVCVLLGGWLLVDRASSNCDRIEQAFDAYTEALVDISDSDEAREAEFRAAYEPNLARCN